MTLGEYVEILRRLIVIDRDALVPVVFGLFWAWIFWKGVSKEITARSNSTLAIFIIVASYIFSYFLANRLYIFALLVVPYFISFGREAYIRLIRDY